VRDTPIKPFFALVTMLLLSIITARGQDVVDKTVAVLSDGVRNELITYSDILWQMALQPGTQLVPPRSEDLNQALQILINQRLFALEAQRLPKNAATDKEIADKINETLSYFSSPAVFEERLKQVGFTSIKDENFQRLMAQRLAIDKYVAFRFESFVVVTLDEERRHYRDVFVPDFRRRSPGLLVPTFDEKKKEIRETLVRQKVAASIERFLDEAKQRVEIEILIEV
jgi:hypothetical protein